MNFREMDIKHSYISKGDDNIADSFLNPILAHTKEYKRSVGFFSSGVFAAIMPGVIRLARNQGSIKLIASPKLSNDDANAIALGYEQRQKYVIDSFNEDFEREIEELDDEKLCLLCDLIRKNILDIKIAVTAECGMYHDKLGILQDFDNNKLVFYGSPNSSYGGYRSNYEKIRISKGWEIGNKEIVDEEIREFDSLWNNTNEFVEVYEYQKIAEKKLIEIIEKRNSKKKQNEIVLRDYQKQAIQAWIDNNYRGFFVMATGTGKTWTAIFSAKELVKKQPALILICAPYKHLVKQWSEDVITAFPTADIIMVSSENPKWDIQVTNAIVNAKYDNKSQIIIISTIASFKNKLANLITRYFGNRLLIVDEAHRFTKHPEALKKIFPYMLGLSATPFSGTSAAKGSELMKFFGGQVFNLPIEEALDKGFLVPYYYYPIYVSSSEEEERRQEAEDRVVELDKLINELNSKNEKYKLYLKKQMKDYDKLTAANEIGKIATAKIEIMLEVLNYFVDKLETESEAYSRKLQVNIQYLLDSMLTSRRTVSVSQEFAVRVTDSYNDESKSEGQFAVVSFAYIGGILKMLKDDNNFQGKEYPLVLDGPFSKLDPDQRQNVVNMLPTFAPQVIVFSKDDLHDVISNDNIGRVWTIVSNDEKNIARVEEGKLWK